MSMELKEKFIKLLKSGKAYSLRRCSICDTNLYFRSDGTALLFDANCDCVRYTTPLRNEPWDSLDFYLDPKHGHLKNIENWIFEHELKAAVEVAARTGCDVRLEDIASMGCLDPEV